MSDFNHLRAIKLIKEFVRGFSLDLRGKTILTELGSNNYLYTPIIPMIAGAEHVIIWTSNNKYFNVYDIVSEFEKVIRFSSLNNRVTLRMNDRPDSDIAIADVITNSGFIRPIDEAFVSKMKYNAVIPLMYEAWELRSTDIDVEACKKYNIKLAGTWENHPDLLVFSSVANLAVKMAIEAGFEVFQNKILVWSDDDFGEEAKRGFLQFGALTVIKTTSVECLMQHAHCLDFIFICDYDEQRILLGKNGIIDIEKIYKINPTIGVVHLYGSIDSTYMSQKGVLLYPNYNGYSMQMSKTLAHVGMIPIIKLQVAGFKVGQLLLEQSKSDLLQLIV